MSDGTCQPNDKGELWCVSSVGLERMPEYSPRRAGKIGGVRFKRINPRNSHWELDEVFGSALYAATWAHIPASADKEGWTGLVNRSIDDQNQYRNAGLLTLNKL